MKEKIANALKTEYANFGLSKAALDGVAAILEKTISDEAGIDAAIKEASVAGLLKVFQSESDSLRTAKANAEKVLAEYKASHPDGSQSSKGGEDNEVLEMLKQMKAEQDSLKAEIAENKKRERIEGVRRDLDTLLKSKKCEKDPIRKRILQDIEISDTDTAQSLLESAESKYNAMYTEFYGEGIQPQRGASHTDGYKKGDFAGFKEQLQKGGLIPSEK